MSSVKITGLEKQRKRILLQIGSAIKKSGFAEALTKDMVKHGRRAGIGGDLRPSTVKSRRYLAKHNTTHPNFEPTKSNLTLTGKLLDSLVGKFIVSKFNFVIDAPKRKHPRYKKGSKVTPKMNDLLKFVTEQGRKLTDALKDSAFKTGMEKKLVNSIQRFFR